MASQERLVKDLVTGDVVFYDDEHYVFIGSRQASSGVVTDPYFYTPDLRLIEYELDPTTKVWLVTHISVGSSEIFLSAAEVWALGQLVPRRHMRLADFSAQEVFQSAGPYAREAMAVLIQRGLVRYEQLLNGPKSYCVTGFGIVEALRRGLIY